ATEAVDDLVIDALGFVDAKSADFTPRNKARPAAFARRPWSWSCSHSNSSLLMAIKALEGQVVGLEIAAFHRLFPTAGGGHALGPLQEDHVVGHNLCAIAGLAILGLPLAYLHPALDVY